VRDSPAYDRPYAVDWARDGHANPLRASATSRRFARLCSVSRVRLVVRQRR
jgi:hypothetical protein